MTYQGTTEYVTMVTQKQPTALNRTRADRAASMWYNSFTIRSSLDTHITLLNSVRKHIAMFVQVHVRLNTTRRRDVITWFTVVSMCNIS